MIHSTERAPRIVAIGDVHGCLAPLDRILREIELESGDTLVMLGDVVDRGPASRVVIDRLLSLRDACQLVCLFGNHEQMMLESVDGIAPTHEWLIHGGAETLDSYGFGASVRSIDPDHIDWIRTWEDFWECESHFFVHGCYSAQSPLESQPWADLRWQPLHWQVPRPHVSGKTAVVGHTANKLGEIVNLGHLVCIDTYCHGGGWLTALEVGSGRVWQARRDGGYRESSLPPVVDRYLPGS